MKEFFVNNTFGIITFIVGIAVTIIIYFLQTRRADSAKLEREKQAKKEIIDTIENYIINEKQVTESTFLNLRSGIERNNGIILDKDWNWMSLLQDISFRLQTSRHLATDQKLEYAKKLDNLIDIWNTDSNLTKSVHSNNEQVIINKILEYSAQKDEKTQNDLKDLIHKLLTIRRYNNAKSLSESEHKITVITRAVTSTFAGLTAAIGVFFIARAIDKKISYESASKGTAQQEIIKTGIQLSNDYQLLLILGMILIIFILFTTLILIRKNKYKSSDIRSTHFISGGSFKG